MCLKRTAMFLQKKSAQTLPVPKFAVAREIRAYRWLGPNNRWPVAFLIAHPPQANYQQVNLSATMSRLRQLLRVVPPPFLSRVCNEMVHLRSFVEHFTAKNMSSHNAGATPENFMSLLGLLSGVCVWF